MPLSTQKKQYLDLMGITVYTERVDDSEIEVVEGKVEHQIESQTASSLQVEVEKNSEIASPQELENKQAVEIPVSVHDVMKREELPEDWSTLIDHVANCERCELHKTRTQTVFGIGDINADWMVIGEAPGIEEDKQGEPFLGQAGQLLTKILESIGLARNKVYLANTLKCKTPANRDPKKSEAAQCRAYLEQQINLVDPKIIICVGRIASQNLLQTEDPISRMRGKVHSFTHPVKLEKDIPVIVTYHPAYLLRSPSQKSKVWDDLKLAFSVLNN